MRIKINIVPALLAVLVTLVALPVHAAEDYWQDLRSLPFPESYPTKQSADRLHDEMLFQRASQVVIWSIPIVSMAQWQYAHTKQLGAENGQIVYIESFDDRAG